MTGAINVYTVSPALAFKISSMEWKFCEFPSYYHSITDHSSNDELVYGLNYAALSRAVRYNARRRSAALFNRANREIHLQSPPSYTGDRSLISSILITFVRLLIQGTDLWYPQSALLLCAS